MASQIRSWKSSYCVNPIVTKFALQPALLGMLLQYVTPLLTVCAQLKVANAKASQIRPWKSSYCVNPIVIKFAMQPALLGMLLQYVNPLLTVCTVKGC